MNHYVIRITLLAIIASNVAVAQSSSPLAGARSNSLGYAASCLTDEWSLYNNPGGLAGVENTVVASSYDLRPALPAGNRMAAVVALPTKYGVTALGVLRFGDKIYNEQILSGGIANHFGITSLGAKINYVQYHAEGFGTKGMVSISLGGITTLAPHIKVGVHIVNLNQPAISADKEERLPTLLITGLAYEPSEKLFITTEIEKDLDYDAVWKTGLEYKPFTRAAFRTGFNIHPSAAFFGAGCYTKKLHIDYALQYSPIMGLSHQVSVNYKLKTITTEPPTK